MSFFSVVRLPNYIHPAIAVSVKDIRLDGLQNTLKKKTVHGRVLSSLDKEKESTSKVPEKQRSLLCGTSWQKDYIKLHDDILNNRRPPRYLVYFCGGKRHGCGGYGNRLGAMTSLLYLAVITNRAFIINWNTSVPLSDYLLPKNINWNVPLSKLAHLKKNYHYWGKGDPQMVTGDYHRSAFDFNAFRSWVEGTDPESYLSSPVEIVTSLWYFAPSFRQHKFAERLADKFGTKQRGHRYSLVGCAFDFLFERRSAFENALSLARDSLKFKPGVPKIGIHVRMGDASSFNGESLDQRTTNFKKFFSCAKKFEKSIMRTSYPNVSREDIKWFLATDNLDVKQFALRKYPDKVLTLSVEIEHIDKNEATNNGMQGVLLDHFLLSECDFLVMSDSSFSKTALGLNFHSTVVSTFGEKCRYLT